MIVVEAGRVHIMTFLPLSCELLILVSVTHFLGEKCGDEAFIYFIFLIKD
jgi:hypothetical protein